MILRHKWIWYMSIQFTTCKNRFKTKWIFFVCFVSRDIWRFLTKLWAIMWKTVKTPVADWLLYLHPLYISNGIGLRRNSPAFWTLHTPYFLCKMFFFLNELHFIKNSCKTKWIFNHIFMKHIVTWKCIFYYDIET